MKLRIWQEKNTKRNKRLNNTQSKWKVLTVLDGQVPLTDII